MLKNTFKNKVLLCIYFGIFVLMSMSMLSNKADNEELSFEKKTVKVSVINEDDSAYADSLIKYLKDNSNIVEIVESDEVFLTRCFTGIRNMSLKYQRALVKRFQIMTG